MTNNELALSIESTWNLINKTAPNCERHKLLLEHFKALLVEQSQRAKESK